MIFKNISKDLNISRKDCFYLFILTVFSIIITYSLINLNENIGIYCSDVFIYLTNSLALAGYGATREYLYLSPLICFLTSILFRLGLLSEVSLYIVTGAFAIFGNIGIYVFLKNRFSSLLSLCGGILFGSFSLNLLWWANGTLDVPAVSLSIWTMIFIICAVDKDSKYYLLAFPLLVLAIFTRYTTLFLLPLILLYYLSYHDFFTNLDLLFLDWKKFLGKLKKYIKWEEFRNILKACVLAFVLFALISAAIINSGSHLSFLTQGSTFASGSKGEVIDNAYTDDTFFYLHDFPNFLFADHVIFDNVIPVLIGSTYLSYLLIGLFAFGIVLSAYKLIKGRKKDDLDEDYDNCSDNDLAIDDGKNSEKGLKNKSFKLVFNCFVAVIFIGIIVAAVLSFRINSIITIGLLLVDFVILFSIFRKKGISRDGYSLNVLMIAWFLVYFIFFTFLNIKVNRYIITVFPSFIYFVILALDGILELSQRFKFLEINSKNILNLIPIILIIFCVFSAFTFPGTVHYDQDFNKNKVIADYLINYDSDYSSKEIAAYSQRSLNWYLKDNAIALRDDQLDYLEASNITYYISDGNFDLVNYTMIYDKDGLYLYERNN